MALEKISITLTFKSYTCNIKGGVFISMVEGVKERGAYVIKKDCSVL